MADAALKRLAADLHARERLGDKLQRVFKLAHSRAGRRLLAEHGVEVLESVDVETLRGVAPAHGRQLDAVERARAKRQKSAGAILRSGP